MCKNDEYTRDFLSYYYKLGLDRPQEDSRLNISQVEFMTSTNFNNVYCFIVPKVNTIIGGTVPNYLNTTIKQEIVNGCADYQGLTHNLVLLDPIYRAITFGSFIEDESATPAFTAIEENDRTTAIRNILDTLNDREKMVIMRRFGIDLDRAETLDEIGKELGLSKERIRQIEATALRKLRNPRRANLLKEFF